MTLPEKSPDIRDRETLEFVAELFGEAKKEKRKYLDRWNRYYRAFRNRTWSEFRPQWAPSPSASEIFPAYHTLVSWMTDQTPILRASPRPEFKESQPAPEIITEKTQDMNALLASWWTNRGCNPQLQMALLDMLIYGTGILKTGWDQSLQQGLGDAFMRRLDPYAALPDPFAASNEDLRYFIECSRVPIFEICSRFPERGHLVQADSGKGEDKRPSERSGFEVVPMANPGATGVTGEFPGSATANIPPRYGYPGFKGSQDYTKTVLLVECWVRTTENYTIPMIDKGEYQGNLDVERPVWQYTAVANGVVLTPDISNPFDHGGLPYIRLPYCEIGEWWSIPMTEHVGPAQVALNRLLAAVQTNAELVGNPIFVEDQNAGISRTKIINRPGGRIVKNAGAEVRWMDPPNVAANVTDMASFWIDEIDKITGAASVRGANLRRREPTGAVEAVQEGAFVRIRSVLRHMEECLRQAGNQTVSNFVQFYIEPRTISEVGPKGSDNYLTFEAKHFNLPVPKGEKEEEIELVPLDFDVWVESGSTQPLSRSARAAEMDTLFFQGVVDEEAVAEAHDIPDRRNTVQRTQEKKAAGMLPSQTNPRKR